MSIIYQYYLIFFSETQEKKFNLKMYFIVYFLQTHNLAHNHVVVPFTWLRLNQHIENIVNNGVNRGLTFTVFYTNHDDAFNNGMPLIDYHPNANASFGNAFPNEGLYHCRIQKFNCNNLNDSLRIHILIPNYFSSFPVSFHEAMVYQNKRRNVAPVLYNAQRLRERPTYNANLSSDRISSFFRMYSPGNISI